MQYSIRHHRSFSRPLIWSGLLLAGALLVVVLLPGAQFGHSSTHVSAQELGKLNQFLQSANAKDDAMKIFRQGRDLVEAGNWSRAAATFNAFVADYPKHKDVDAALSWMAFALKKQGRYAEADQQAERLLREYPRSNWRDDARAMRVELAGQTGNRQVVDNELNKNDREIKLIALQSLFQSNPERAAAFVTELLKPGSQADTRLKEHAIMLLGQHSGATTTPLLLELARKESDPRLRKTAIFWLGQSGGESAANNLLALYDGEQSLEVKKQILFALSQQSSAQARAKLVEIARSGGDLAMRKQALFALSQHNDDASLGELISIFNADTNTEIRKQVLFALMQSNSARAQAKMMEVARTASEVEVRKQAIFWLGQRGDAQTVTTLAQLYDAEQDARLKEQLLFALSQSNQPAALQKLMQVAKSDASIELRKKAIFMLGQSRDPQAVKFIEDILK